MAALPYMPLYIADYLADAAHLSTIEHGAYLLLIMTYWQRGEPLPSDDKKLSRIVRMTPDEWADARETLAEFFHDDGTTWTHINVEAELDRLKEADALKMDMKERLLGGPNFVYVMAREDGLVKVGVSCLPERRVLQLNTQHQKKHELIDQTECAQRRQAFELERTVHDHLGPTRVEGEYFSCGVDVAVDTVRRLSIATASPVYKMERARP